MMNIEINNAPSAPPPPADATPNTEWVIRCPCGIDADQRGDCIQCDECGVWQHCRCVNEDGSNPDPDYKYMCEWCNPAAFFERTNMVPPFVPPSTHKNHDAILKLRSDNPNKYVVFWCLIHASRPFVDPDHQLGLRPPVKKVCIDLNVLYMQYYAQARPKQRQKRPVAQAVEPAPKGTCAMMVMIARVVCMHIFIMI